MLKERERAKASKVDGQLKTNPSSSWEPPVAVHEERSEAATVAVERVDGSPVRMGMSLSTDAIRSYQRWWWWRLRWTDLTNDQRSHGHGWRFEKSNHHILLVEHGTSPAGFFHHVRIRIEVQVSGLNQRLIVHVTGDLLRRRFPMGRRCLLWKSQAGRDLIGRVRSRHVPTRRCARHRRSDQLIPTLHVHRLVGVRLPKRFRLGVRRRD